MKTWLTVAEGAAYAGVSRDTIYTACERRELNHARVGGRRAIRLKAAWIDLPNPPDIGRFLICVRSHSFSSAA